MVLVLCSVLSVQFGQALGKQLFAHVSPEGVVTLRLIISAILVGIVVRPRLPRSAQDYVLAVCFGTAIAGMNVVYLALQYLPVGVAATIQLLGPLGVAIAMSRKFKDILWSLLAIAGLALFAIPSLGNAEGLSPWGLCLAAFSAVSMGAYILLSKKAGSISSDGRFLALALIWSSIIWTPFGVTTDGTTLLDPYVLLMGAIIAVLSAAVPYSLELVALRSISPRVVGTLQSLEPVMGSLAGLIVLAELLTAPQLVAVLCVTVASIASVLSRNRRRVDPIP